MVPKAFSIIEAKTKHKNSPGSRGFDRGGPPQDACDLGVMDNVSNETLVM